MAEDQVVTALDGQEADLESFDLVAEEAAKADDRVLAELLHMLPFDGTTVTKAIVPSMTADGAIALTPGLTGLVWATGGGSGGVKGGVFIRPFRAIIGSRTAIAADPLVQPFPPSFPSVDNWRDIRSKVFAPQTVSDGTIVNVASTPGDRALGAPVFFVANSSGQPRWDRVVARVTIDVASASDTRIVKPTGIGNSAPQTVSPTKITTISLAVIQGTPAASPSPPNTFPDDPASGVFFIPICDVTIANGFDPTSTIPTAANVHVIAPIATLSGSMGAVSAKPATRLSTKLDNSTIHSWGSTGARQGYVMPTTMAGTVRRWICIDLDANFPANGDVVDDSIDWRFRIFEWRVLGIQASGGKFAFATGGTATNVIPEIGGTDLIDGSGQSFVGDSSSVFAGSPPSGKAAVLRLTNANAPAWLASGKDLGLYVDLTTGALKIWSGNIGAASAKFFIRLDASGQYEGFAP